ncbi:MAG: hypothetical protein OEZ68_00970 [Gammaproteobacteria bacterium]|nr:hypothetical protein [Gammaproteobacteria bacterium]MDH5799350.1 hypothetical protein [Gammaproteobacteria bacterium]
MKVSKLQELVPLYINGAMSENDRRVFGQALKQNSVLKQEYMEFYELDSIIGHTESVDLKQLEQLFKTLDLNKSAPAAPKIKPEPQKEPEQPIKPAIPLTESQEIRRVERDLQNYDDDYRPEKFSKEYFLYVFSSPKVAWAIIGLQFVLLSLLAVFRFPHSLPDSAEGNNVEVMNVVFADTATQKDIRELLVDMKAQIANGPTDIGLYTIYIRNNARQTELMIDRLKKSKLILLAEPAFAGKPR